MSTPSDSDPATPKPSIGENLVLVLCILAIFVLTFCIIVAIAFLHMNMLFYIATAAHIPRGNYDGIWEWRFARLRATLSRRAKFSAAFDKMAGTIAGSIGAVAWIGVLFYFQFLADKPDDSWSVMWVLPTVVGLASLTIGPVLLVAAKLLLPRSPGEGISDALARCVERWD